jgi:2-succinyl-5-enolpyruvyl-6-hydroxy-3-cyclohexene-1-carboxylate synthase
VSGIDTGAANLDFARALLAGLAEGAVAAYLCPGSRSTPLALALTGTTLPRHVVIDERSAAFQALGHAKVARRPVLLVCTSGTAGAHLLPAIAEAHHARVPLIVLTADRPPEQRAWGAAQTMEQRTLYQGFTRWCEEAPAPVGLAGEPAYAAALARRALAEAMGPAPGPVHLNLPFREPLLPLAPMSLGIPSAAPCRSHDVRENRHCTGIADAVLTRELAVVGRGVLLLGPDSAEPGVAAALADAARTLGWPVIADPASGLRGDPALSGVLIEHADLLLRAEACATSLAPELVVRLGGLPTSKALAQWLVRHDSVRLWLLDPAGGWRDPTHRAERVLRMSLASFCASAAEVLIPAAPDWLEDWHHCQAATRAALEQALASETTFGAPQLTRALWQALPEDALLLVGNSMPIRDLDAYAGQRATALQALGQRGVNGIDGLVSVALGAAAAHRGPVVLYCGDITLLHDVAGLLAARLAGADLTIICLNDDGGGIFEHLPVAQAIPRADFEALYALPHGMDLAALATGLGWKGVRVRDEAGFRAALGLALAGGRHLIEIAVDRAANTALRQRLVAAVGQALAAS